MRILVTGGNGFVGSAVISQLARQPHEHIAVLDNLMSGSNAHPDIYLYHDDIRDAFRMSQIIPDYDLVIHLAGVVGVPACAVDEQFAFDVNVTGTQNIVRNLKPGAKIIFTSSTSSYGNKVNQLVTEETTLTPLTNYGLHKLYNETEVIRNTNNYIIVRPATAFGMSLRTRLDVLPNTLIYDALTQPKLRVFEPHVIRPFIHVHDFARVLVYAANDNMPWGEIYNIGDPHLTMSKGELATKIAKSARDTHIEYVDGADPDQRNYNVSFDKLLATGFKFPTSALQYAFEQIESNLDIIKENPERYNTPYNVKEYIKEYGNRYA